ncbi:MAG: sensor domain-containing diguanylate cyclase [Alphaproteobacteria bacterium]|nr:sensor domain-containing diguanylate cyclase [Alphaproteobacteria bacterium]
MGNYEIFSSANNLMSTLFALACLIFAGFCAIKEKKLEQPIKFLMIAFIFDVICAKTEANVFAAALRGEALETRMMIELFFLLGFTVFMSLAASAFIADFSFKSTLPVWILSVLGVVAIVLFTQVITDGNIVNDMRLIFPLSAFLYLMVGLVSRFNQPAKGGYVFAFILSLGVAGLIFTRFFTFNQPWYLMPMSYILYALSFLLMKNDVLYGEIEKSNKEIEKYNQKIEEIIKLSPFPIIISRLGDDKIVLANNNAMKLFGIRPSDINHRCLKEFFADSDNRRLLLEKIEEQKEVQDFEVLIKTPMTDTPFWLLTSANIIDYNYDVALYSAFQDITSRKSREAILQNQAMRDPLTSLYNRRYFEEEVKKMIIQAKNNRQPYSVLMLDADFFKKVNDTYGHKVGDKVLIELASMAEKDLREKDIVARYGGEEFVVFLPDITAEQAYKVADRLRQNIASIVVKSDDGQDVLFTVSVGVSSSEISDNVDMLVKTADEALYKAKQNGRNRVEVFTTEDLTHFINEEKRANKEEKNNLHPIYDRENTAEISLLDGVDAKDIQEPIKN